MPRGREPRPTMQRGRGARPAMPRGRVPPRPRVLGRRERRLAEEVLHLHSLWRRGPPPAPARAPSPNQSGSADRKTKTTGNKRRKLDGAAPAAAEPKNNEAEWAPAPPPPNSSPKAWPEAAPSSSTPAKPPPRPASPGELAQHKAVRAAAEFFSNRGASSSSSSDDDEEEGSESEGGQDAAGFLTGLFERDAALRGHYERGWEDAQLACMVCAAGARKARRFRGCLALVQHAHDATPRYGRRRAHRALAAVLCRVLGWDFARLPSIVMDPRGTLGQAIAAGATAGVQLAKENVDTGEDTDSSSDEDEEEYVETGMDDSSTDDDEEENELDNSEESAEEDDVDTGMEDSSTDGDEEENELESSEESAEKEDFKKGTEDSKNTDKDEAIDPDNSDKSAQKEEIEEIGPTNCLEISKNEVFCNEPVQEVNASTGDSLNQGNNGLVHKQEVAKESSEQENTNDTYLPGSKDAHKNKELL